MIGIVDYGMGNLRSLRNALDFVGLEVDVFAEPSRIGEFSHLIVPGVGAFGRAMENLRARGFVEPLRAHAAAGKPLMGICLGMQLLASRSLEFGDHEGLGLVPGRVIPFEASEKFPVPHVGWNDLTVVKKHPLLAKANAKRAVDYYYVHSFYFSAEEPGDVVATSDYGRSFTAIVGRGSVVGTQFHPEKSQAGGRALLEGFAEWDGGAR
jgi:imidazole glycerol-phosphate synthase subunit HisH